MMKLSRSLCSFRNQLSEKLLAGKANDVRDALTSHALISQAGMSTTSQDVSAKGSLGGRIFAPYYVYKGKAAFSVDPVLPTFMKLDSGDLRVKRKGVILLTFAPAFGERKYDWEKKQNFALSPTEVGSLLSMGPGDSSEFFHDPAMKSSNAGQMRKTLSIKANADGYFISLNVTNNILKTSDRFVVPVSTAEFAVMKTACSFALPHLMGWDRLTNQLPKSSTASLGSGSGSGLGSSSSSAKVDQQFLDLEWDK